jgi:hypothetical protein
MIPAFAGVCPISGSPDDPGFCRGLPYGGGSDDPGFAGVCPAAGYPDDPGFCRGLPCGGSPDDPDFTGVCPAAGAPMTPVFAGVCPMADSPASPGFAGVCPITDPAFTKPKNVRGATAIHPPPPVRAQGIEGAQKSTRNIERVVESK